MFQQRWIQVAFVNYSGGAALRSQSIFACPMQRGGDRGRAICIIFFCHWMFWLTAISVPRVLRVSRVSTVLSKNQCFIYYYLSLLFDALVKQGGKASSHFIWQDICQYINILIVRFFHFLLLYLLIVHFSLIG